MSDTDTKFVRVIRLLESYEDQEPETIQCDDSTDALKISDCRHVVIVIP